MVGVLRRDRSRHFGPGFFVHERVVLMIGVKFDFISLSLARHLVRLDSYTVTHKHRCNEGVAVFHTVQV